MLPFCHLLLMIETAGRNLAGFKLTQKISHDSTSVLLT
jgi:hypothetical protein